MNAIINVHIQEAINEALVIPFFKKDTVTNTMIKIASKEM